MDKFSATYEGFLLDMFQWHKVQRWSFNSLFSKLSGKNDDPNDFVMNIVMPEKCQIKMFLKNSFLDSFPAQWLENMRKVRVANFTITSVANVKEFLQSRYFVTFNKVLPYNMACYEELFKMTDTNIKCGALAHNEDNLIK